MNKLLRHSTFAWALIAAQLLVVVLGHGRVVVCHDESGASHIELFGDKQGDIKNTTNPEDLCGLITGATSSPASGLCSDVPCEDELFGFVFTLSQPRSIGPGLLAGLIPAGPISVDVWAFNEDTAGNMAQAVGFDETTQLRAHYRSIRSTVMRL